MTDLLSLELVSKGLVTDQLVLDLGYDAESLSDPRMAAKYFSGSVLDRYNRRVPKPAKNNVT